MRKSILALCLAGLSLVSSSALADDKASAIATTKEHRGLKPGAGVYVFDRTINVVVGTRGYNGTKQEKGWEATGLTFSLWGKTDSSEVAIVKWRNGKKVGGSTECPLKDVTDEKETSGEGWDDEQEVRCEPKGIAFDTFGTFEADILLRSVGKPDTLLRTINFTVRNAPTLATPSSTFNVYVDHDYKLAETVAFWEPDSVALKLRTYAKLEQTPTGQGKMRCTVDGQPLALTSQSEVYAGGDGSFEVEDARKGKIAWVALEGSLILDGGGRASGKWKAGKYECQMVVKGKLMRTIRFALDGSLNVVRSGEQQAGKAGALVSKRTLLTDVDIPAGVDLPFNRAAFEKQAFLGRGFRAGAPKLAAGVTAGYKEPKTFVQKAGR